MSIVINPSSIISAYCYSIFRLEPVHYCRFSCLYCYARWYRQEDSRLTRKMMAEFLHFLHRVRRAGIRKVIPFRMATLVDPFQPDELSIRRATKLMDLCIEYDIPLIVNTKSTLILDEKLLKRLVALRERGGVLVQISIPNVRGKAANILEPGAPPVEARIELLEKLREHDIPTAVRLQPLFPWGDEDVVRDLVADVVQAGAEHVIVESARLDAPTLERLKSLGLKPEVRWIQYVEGLSPGVLTPERQWRLKFEAMVRDLCTKLGVGFGVCKEDIFYLTTSDDCCGMYLLRHEKVAKRITVRELYEVYSRTRTLPSITSIHDLDAYLRNLGGERYLTLDDLALYPRNIRRKVLQHLKLLVKNYAKILTSLQDASGVMSKA